VLVGVAGDQRLRELRTVALAAALPGATIMTVPPDAVLPAGHPAEGKGMVEGRPAAYLCADQACLPPITDPARLAAALSEFATNGPR
jgi:uncharacterized protein YyaL (SSP411 family)